MNGNFQSIRTVIVLLFSISSMNAQWTRTSRIQGDLGPTQINCFAISDSNIVVGGNNGIFVTTDDGTTWTKRNEGLRAGPQVFALAANGSNLFAGLQPGGVYRSTDNGGKWVAVNNGIPATTVTSLVVSNGNLLAGTILGVFRTADNGTNWTAVDSGLTANPCVYCLAVSGANLFAGTAIIIYPPHGVSWPVGTGIYRSTNNGTSWDSVSTGLPIPNDVVTELSVLGANLFAGTIFHGVYLSSDNGISWDAANTGLTNDGITAFAVTNTDLFVGTQGGVFLFNNSGTSWTSGNAGLPAYNWIRALVSKGTNLFASVDTSVWKRPLSEMITSVEQSSLHMPNTLDLQQNFPNPFNPSTTIRYGLPNRSHVTLTVFNTLGQQVALLQNGEQVAGYHEVRFDGSGLSSGVYFYRIEAGSFIQTRKLLLLR